MASNFTRNINNLKALKDRLQSDPFLEKIRDLANRGEAFITMRNGIGKNNGRL